MPRAASAHLKLGHPRFPLTVVIWKSKRKKKKRDVGAFCHMFGKSYSAKANHDVKVARCTRTKETSTNSIHLYSSMEPCQKLQCFAKQPVCTCTLGHVTDVTVLQRRIPGQVYYGVKVDGNRRCLTGWTEVFAAVVGCT